MILTELMRARRARRRRRVACRDQWGHRSALVPRPRSDGCGVVLETPYGPVTLSVLEAGRLRERLAAAVVESAELLAAADRAADRTGGVSR